MTTIIRAPFCRLRRAGPAAAVLAISFLSLVLPRSAVHGAELLVPAYFYPTLGPYWAIMDSTAQHVRLTAILDPANGPGTVADPNYVAAVNSLRASGGNVLGYVTSSYAGRPLADVEAEVDRYPTFYAIDGIFVDEMVNDTLAIHYAYYEELYDYIKAHHASYRVIGNPGTGTQEPYLSLPTVDGLVTFENSTGYPSYVPDAWVFHYPPGDFAHIVYGVTSPDTMLAYIRLAAARDAGMVFITDGGLPNPYDHLPPYWDAEAAEVESLAVVSAVTPRSGDVADSGPMLTPNPCAGGCVIRLGRPAAGRVTVRIVDLGGRVVARLPAVAAGATVHWDGRDDRSRACPAGLYFVVAEGGADRWTRKLIVAR